MVLLFQMLRKRMILKIRHFAICFFVDILKKWDVLIIHQMCHFYNQFDESLIRCFLTRVLIGPLRLLGRLSNCSNFCGPLSISRQPATRYIKWRTAVRMLESSQNETSDDRPLTARADDWWVANNLLCSVFVQIVFCSYLYVGEANFE